MAAIMLLLIMDLVSYDVDIPVWAYLALVLVQFVWSVVMETVE